MRAPQHNGWMFRVGSSNAEGLTVSGTALSVRTSVDEARRLIRQNQGWIDVQGRTQLGQPGIERHLRGRMPASGHRLAARPNTLEKNTARIAERLFNHPVCDSWQIVLLSRHYPALLPKGFSSNPTSSIIPTGHLASFQPVIWRQEATIRAIREVAAHRSMNGESRTLPSVSATGMPTSWNALVAERVPMVEYLTLEEALSLIEELAAGPLQGLGLLD